LIFGTHLIYVSTHGKYECVTSSDVRKFFLLFFRKFGNIVWMLNYLHPACWHLGTFYSVY